MTKKHKKQLLRILLSAAINIVAFFLPVEGLLQLMIYLISYAIIGSDVLWKAFQNIRNGQVFDENFLMAVATIGAFFLGQYEEGVAVMLFYQIGELFQSYAVNKSRRSIAELMDIRPDYANIWMGGQLVQVEPEQVKIDELIVVKPGERIPLDGIVTEGFSTIDTSALTGESIPREVEAGNEVISGCINQTGRLTVKVTKEFGESTVAKILDLVENSSSKKAKAENFIAKFARYYTPAVVYSAIGLAIIPPVITGQEFSIWFSRALTFLVISCPCALVISVPLSFFGGIGGASKSGILVKGSNYLEALADTEMVVFDKTGTLTKGSFAVSKVHSETMDAKTLLELAAYAEDSSSHPISVSIKKAYGKSIHSARIEMVEEVPGRGVKARIDGMTILAGNNKLMGTEQIAFANIAPAGTVVHVAVDGTYAGYILIEDEIKADSRKAIADLKAAGIRQTVMLTGDVDAVGRKVADALGLDKVYTELLPVDKVEHVEELMRQKSARGQLVFVGDGINDAPVLARADIGIAMGGLGSDAAIEAADVVIMTDEPSKIATVIKISKKTLAIVHQNIWLALGVKFVVLGLGAAGYASMWAAIFSDVGVSVIAILNAMRALYVKDLLPPGQQKLKDTYCTAPSPSAD